MRQCTTRTGQSGNRSPHLPGSGSNRTQSLSRRHHQTAARRKVDKDVTLEGEVLQALSELLTQKPQYDWSPVNWHEGPALPDNVINKVKDGVTVELEAVMDYIVENIEEEAFKDEADYQKAKRNSQCL